MKWRYYRRFPLKRWIPTSLFSRALIILLLPVLLTQVIVAYFFFERHWQTVARNMSNALSGEVAMLVTTYQRDPKSAEYTREQASNMGIRMTIAPRAGEAFNSGYSEPAYRKFYHEVKQRLALPVNVITVNDRNDTLIRVALNADTVMKLQTSRKRLASVTTDLFILWMGGSVVLLVTVAVLFLRNQIRPIATLARVAEQFGMGQDADDFAPRGAAEVRQAGRAFLVMRERLRRQIVSRTEMLAGISHDLRTPLTRMQLQIALAPLHEAQKKTLEEDIHDMNHMIEAYLEFARGDVGEQPESMDIAACVNDVVTRYHDSGKPVYLKPISDEMRVILLLRPHAIKRCLTNLIDNALRYGQHAHVEMETGAVAVRIRIEDAGNGIPENAQAEVFKPFTRLEASRNSKTGGIGLGLSIARDIAHAHGGEITLENKRDAAGNILGLLATLRLPRGSMR
jgi:two-component system osmolarity sensor histidine kinase EnvZ